MPVQVPMIDAAAVSAALPMRICIDLMAKALCAHDRGDVVQPLRSVIRLPDGSGSLYTMPAFTAEPRALAVKLITIFHGNEGGPLPTHQGLVVVFDPATGAPALLLDAARLTAIRTAAVSAAATDALANPDAGVLAVLGTGVQARSHIEALRLVRPLRQVRVWGRSLRRAQQLCAELGDGAVDIVACDSVETTVRDAAIVCATTAAREPVLHGAWLAPGTHINAIGASTRDARELDAAAVAAARVFVDSLDAAGAEAGDLILAAEEGATAPAAWTAIGAVLDGRAPGRGGADEITLFKSVGLAIEDAAAAAYIAQHLESVTMES